MSDRSAMWIKIGGALKEEDVEEFVELISTLGFEYGDELGDEAEDAIRSHDGRSSLDLFVNEQSGGIDEDLEGFCRMHGLSYCRGDDGHYAYSAEMVLWLPGMEQPTSWTSDSENGGLYLSVTRIDELLKTGGLDVELALMRQARNFAVPFSAPPWPAEEGEAA